VSPGLSRLLGRILLIVLTVLLVEVLVEGWLVTLFGHRAGLDATGDIILEPAQWPKTVKTALYGLLALLTIAKLTVDRAWHTLTTKADIALLVAGAVMAVAGFAGGSSAVLIAQGLFVYFRAVIVFYAFRALRPSLSQVKPLFWIGGTIISVSAVIGFLQFLLGDPLYTLFGWVNLQWSDEARGQGLLDHPNDLGHLAGFVALGLLAWFLYREKVGKRWWALFGLMALAMAEAQSRQSMIATIGAMVVTACFARRHVKRIIAAAAIVVVMAGLPYVVSPESRYQLAYRLGGLFNALGIKIGPYNQKACQAGQCDQEIRVLFLSQGVKLWAASPVLGYGVGQFGGIVAVRADAQWHRDPRFVEVLGPAGFDLHRFKSTSVDMFWLHLLVEVGLLGTIAYLVWLFFLARPLMRSAWRSGWRRGPPSEGSPLILWAVGALAFGVAIGVWSPALEDPVFPPLLFGVLGLGWVMTRRQAEEVKAEVD
jgi:hypothetical protein